MLSEQRRPLLARILCESTKDTSKWKDICLEDDGQWNEDAWEFFFGAYAEAVSNLKTQRVKKPEECEDNKPWDESCDPDALEYDHQVMKGLEGMTSCS